MPLLSRSFRSCGRSSFHVDDVPATPASIGELHHEFTAWISGTVRTTAGRLNDITLVVYEALVNTGHHVSPGDTRPDQVSLDAHYSHKTRSLHVAVHNHDERSHRARGQTVPGLGIDLIHALCDQPVITTTTSGTEMDLNWTLFA